jgi:hypothetical protein
VQGGWSRISIETAVPPEFVAVLARVFNVH